MSAYNEVENGLTKQRLITEAMGTITLPAGRYFYKAKAVNGSSAVWQGLSKFGNGAHWSTTGLTTGSAMTTMPGDVESGAWSEITVTSGFLWVWESNI